MNNPPAFPSPKGTHFQNEGMTLRDYFAAKAMQSLITDRSPLTNEDYAAVCRWSYKFSDAMLKAREQ